MKLLGAVLAGGEGRRFGSDKAMATLRGKPLIDHVVAALAPRCEAVRICGRGDLADRPGLGLGPLAGINAALHAAGAEGFDAVLASPCDTPILPPPLLDLLTGAGGPAYVAQLPLLGFWPVALGEALDAYLAAGADRAVRAWAESVGARAIAWTDSLPNVNFASDLTDLYWLFP